MITQLQIKDFISSMDEDFILIDTRSPDEFGESHIKNAINLYVLDNDQRKEIGTLYKKSPFKAKMSGASLISLNVAKYLQKNLSELTPKTKIFIYCARGGQRSGSFGAILDSIGFRVYKLENGYKSYRNYILNYLENFSYDKFLVLDGLTGSGKSEIIREFKNAIDLEKIANHYGSSFGAVNGAQPSVKQFQNSIYDEIERVKHYDITLLEGESKKIGKLHIPHKLHKKMLNSPHVWIESTLEERAKRILKDYQMIDKEFFENAMGKITPYIKKEYLIDAKKAYYNNDLKTCAMILLEKYYDKVYKKRGDYITTIKFENLEKTIKEIKNLSLKL